jgi:hypothetical protein
MAITTLPTPCWYLVIDGEEQGAHWEGPDHHESREAALAAFTDEDAARVEAKQYDTPCVEVTCNAACNNPRFEDYDSGRWMHLPDMDVALSMLRADGWVIGFGAAAWHGHCAPSPVTP